MWIVWLADNSHETPSLISLKINKTRGGVYAGVYETLYPQFHDPNTAYT